jgi:MarR family transcriptional regulator, temperature-dependent positive regulator of motility
MNTGKVSASAVKGGSRLWRRRLSAKSLRPTAGPVLEELGLPSYQAKLLVLVTRNPGWSQQQLAAETGRDKAQVARAVKELEERGLIARAAHASDPRARGITVTEVGRRAAQRVGRERMAAGKTLIAALDRHDQKVFAELLEKLVTQLG